MLAEKFREFMRPLLPEGPLTRRILERCRWRVRPGFAVGGDTPDVIMPPRTAAEILSWKKGWRPYWPDSIDFSKFNEPFPYLLLPQNIDRRDQSIITALFKYMEAVRTPQFGSSALILPARFKNREIYDSFSPKILLNREGKRIGFQATPDNIIGAISRQSKIQAFETIYSPLGVYLAADPERRDVFTDFFIFSTPIDPNEDLKRF